jgi:hypothetical protein
VAGAGRRVGKKKFTHESIFGFIGNHYIEPEIGWMVPYQADTQIVAGEGGSCIGIRILVGPEGEDAEGAADLGLAEGGGLAFA